MPDLTQRQCFVCPADAAMWYNDKKNFLPHCADKKKKFFFLSDLNQLLALCLYRLYQTPTSVGAHRSSSSVCVCCVWLTCYGVHGLSAVVGALWGALTGGEPPCGAAGEVHVRPAGSWTPQPAPRVKHPPHMPHPTGLVVMLGVKEHIKSGIMVLRLSFDYTFHL